MQYLYDDTPKPLRFFTNIVMRCVNDALDHVTSSNQQKEMQNTMTHTTVENSAPMVVEMAAHIIEGASPPLATPVSPRTGSSATTTKRQELSAFFAANSALLLGFPDGSVTLANAHAFTQYSSACGDLGAQSLNERAAVEVTEIPPQVGNSGPVIALHCVAMSDTQFAVAIGYQASVHVLLTTAKKSCYTFMSRRRKFQQRTVDIDLAQWGASSALSSIKLSPNASHIVMNFENDTFMTIAALPALEVPRDTNDEDAHVALEPSARVVSDGGHGAGYGNRKARVFFIPDPFRTLFSTHTHGPLSSGCSTPGTSLNTGIGAQSHSHVSSQLASDTNSTRRYFLSLLLWTGSADYVRFPLYGTKCAAPRRPPSSALKAASLGENVSKKSKSSTLSNKLSKTRGKGANRGRTEDLESVRRDVSDPYALSGLQRGIMPSCIVFAEVACSDGSIVATVCENGCIYFMDSRGITLVCVGEPRQLQQLHASAMLPPLPGGSSHLVATIIFGSGDGVSIAHARGVPVTDFTPWAGLKYVEGLQGFCAVALLGELPLALIFCKAAVYLWDVHHNCVVATLTGLPPIVPYTLQEETVVVRKSLSQASSKQQELFTLLCTGTAVLWQTHNGSYAYLPFTTLLSSVYPLLLQRFPSAPLQTLAWVLQKVPPHHRHVPDRITAVALLSSSQTQEISTISTGTCGMSCSQPFSFSTCKSPARVTERTVEPLYHDVAMARFFESICNSENVLNNELMRLFHSA